MKMISELKVSEREVKVCKDILDIACEYDLDIAELVEVISKSFPGVYNHYLHYQIRVEESRGV